MKRKQLIISLILFGIVVAQRGIEFMTSYRTSPAPFRVAQFTDSESILAQGRQVWLCSVEQDLLELIPKVPQEIKETLLNQKEELCRRASGGEVEREILEEIRGIGAKRAEVISRYICLNRDKCA